MTYLLTQMMLYMLCALILGLILGWLIWGRLSERLRRSEAERAELEMKLNHTGDGSEMKVKYDSLNADLAVCQRERRVQEEELERLKRELSIAESRTDGLTPSRGQTGSSTVGASQTQSVGASKAATVGAAATAAGATAAGAAAKAKAAGSAATKAAGSAATKAAGSAATKAAGSASKTAGTTAAGFVASDEAKASGGAATGSRPSVLTVARGGKADDLKLIKGVGPKMEKMLNGMGFYHFDQIASWSPSELAWVDDNLEGFKGRASRDEWIGQAKTLAAGGQTTFSKNKS